MQSCGLRKRFEHLLLFTLRKKIKPVFDRICNSFVNSEWGLETENLST